MRLPLAAALALVPAIAFADPAGIQVEHAWSRAMPAGATGVVYLTITDRGAPNALTGASSPVAAMAELHQTINDNGVMKMRPVARLPVAQGKPATLAPGGYHIMLMGLKQALVAGSSFPVTLTFAEGGQLTAMVMVQKPGATMPGMNNGSTGNMGNMDMHGMSMGGSGSK
jgi:periplasmic copper chaperone A